MKRYPLHHLGFALVALCLAAAAPGCKKKPQHSPLPLGSVALAESSSTTRLPSAGTLVVVEGLSLRVAGRFIDDCPVTTEPPCTAEYQFVPGTAAAIPFPVAPMGDAYFLTSPEGQKAVTGRRAALAKFVDALRPLASEEEAARSDAGVAAGTTLLAVLPPATHAWMTYDLLYSAHRAGFGDVRFLVQTPKGSAVVAPSLPDRPVGPALSHLVVQVDDQGLDLRTPAGHVGPGCEGVEQGTTVPGPKPDLAALAACASKTRDATPALGETVEIVASSKTPFQDLVRLFDALARKTDGSPFFPDIRLHSTKPSREPMTPPPAASSASPGASSSAAPAPTGSSSK